MPHTANRSSSGRECFDSSPHTLGEIHECRDLHQQYISSMYKWEKIVHEFTSTWEIKPLISLLYKPNVYFESILYIDTLVSLEEIILLSEVFDSVERNVLIQCHLSKYYFTCPYCNIVCRGDGLTDYRNHSCRYSKLNCVKVNNTDWDCVTVSEHIAIYNRTHYNYPGKNTRVGYDRSFDEVVDKLFVYTGKYFKFPGEITSRKLLEEEDHAMNLVYDNYMKQILALV